MKKTKNFFITGTDTDIGKTYVSALLYKGLKNYGCDYYKPVQSGAKSILTSDVGFVSNFNKIIPQEKMCTYSFKEPVSPHLASEISGVNIDLKKILEYFSIEKENFTLVEGAGGLYTPLVRNKVYIFNLIKLLDLPVIVVCSTKIGTINHTMLTIEFLKNKNIKIHSIIFNNYTSQFYETDNIKVILEESKIKNFLIVKKDQKSIPLEEINKIFNIK
jgi:dethiobiotin synthetase